MPQRRTRVRRVVARRELGEPRAGGGAELRHVRSAVAIEVRDGHVWNLGKRPDRNVSLCTVNQRPAGALERVARDPRAVGRPEDSEVHLAVPVGVQNHGNVTGYPHKPLHLLFDRRIEDVPRRGRVGRPEGREIRTAVAVEIGRERQIAGRADADSGRRARGVVGDVPRGGRWPEDDQISAPISIDIRGARHIAPHAQPSRELTAYEPLRRRHRCSEDRDVDRPVAVVIGGDRDVSHGAKLDRNDFVLDDPLGRGRAVDSLVEYSVAIVVSRHRNIASDAERYPRAALDEPPARGGSEDGEVCEPVAREIARRSNAVLSNGDGLTRDLEVTRANRRVRIGLHLEVNRPVPASRNFGCRNEWCFRNDVPRTRRRHRRHLHRSAAAGLADVRVVGRQEDAAPTVGHDDRVAAERDVVRVRKIRLGETAVVANEGREVGTNPPACPPGSGARWSRCPGCSS